MTHLLFLQRDHTNSKQTKTAFTGAGHHRRHRAHRRHPHGHHHPLLLCHRHDLLRREHWRSAHHHLDRRPGRHLLPHPLDLLPLHDYPRRLHLPTPDPRDHLTHRLYPPNLDRHDPLNRRLCLPPHDHPNHPCPPNHRGRRDRPHAPILDDRSPPVRENLHAP